MKLVIVLCSFVLSFGLLEVQAEEKAGAARGDKKERGAEKQKEKEKEKEKPKEKDRTEAGAPRAGAKSSAVTASSNLKVPEDLPPDVRKALEEAIHAFEESSKGPSGSARLLTQAISKLKSASQKASKSPLPYYYLGIAYQRQHNFTQARTSLDKALKLNPRFHEAILELGDVDVWQKKPKDALVKYDNVLAIEPRYVLALERKAMAQIKLGDFAAAKQSFLDAQKIEKRPEFVLSSLRIDQEIKGPGWTQTYTAETENYKVVTSVSDDLAKEIAHHAELIRRAYNVVFSDIAKPDRKYEIWVYEDLEAYHKAGGPPQAAGHYDPVFRKLVVPRQKNKSLTYTVLYHEAFHQYLDDYLDLAPQWFNEGLGDYFGAFEYAKVGDKERMNSKPSAMRLGNAQSAISGKFLPPASELMVMSQKEMYEPEMAGYHYAQAWAMIYFLIEGNKPEYKRVLINYFNLLRKGKDLNEAYEQSFGKIDMVKFDAEWKGFIANLGRKRQ